MKNLDRSHKAVHDFILLCKIKLFQILIEQKKILNKLFLHLSIFQNSLLITDMLNVPTHSTRSFNNNKTAGLSCVCDYMKQERE